jgi:hypothetical protein
MDMAMPLEQYRAYRRRVLLDAFLAHQRSAAPCQSRRMSARAYVALPITLGLGEWETDTQTRELSSGGCSFSMARPPTQSDMTVALELQRGVVLRCQARMVGLVRRQGGYHVCVTFVGLSQAQRDALSEIVLATLLSQQQHS